MATFNDVAGRLGYDILSPMYAALGGQGNPFFIENQNGGPGTFLGGNQAMAMGFDPSFFDPYQFDFQSTGKGNAGTLTAFKDGQRVGSWDQKDEQFGESLLNAGLLAGGAFGGLGLAGMGPLSGLSGVASGGSNLLSGLASAPELGGIAALPGDFGAIGGLGGIGGGMDFGSILGGISGKDWLSLGGNLLSGFMGQKASKDASGALLDAGRESNALQKYIFDTIRADNQPLVDLRNGTIPQINALMMDPGSITSQPGYQFEFDQGMKALDQSAASRGMLYSGAQMKGAQQFGQDYAGTKLTDSLNRLIGVANLGQIGSSSNNQAATNYGTNAGNTLQQMGNARASGYVGANNAWGSALGNILNDWQFRDVMGRP